MEPLPLHHFEDILEPRRKEISNFLWVSRELTPKLPHKRTRQISPEGIKFEVLNSAKIQILIEKECAREDVPRDKILKRIKNILDEIGYNKNLQVIRWLGLALAKICSQVCSGINVNKFSIMKVRNEIGNVPVMYVPSHRSYADFILMSYICFHYNIEIPAIAAGMDFHGMWGMGTVLRNTGAFFMRRSYNDDSVYWDTFREYVHQLVLKSEMGIEFFIEGTRSRSGKSLHPKLGLLSMILKAFLFGEVPDILFVPINISYDRIMEERLFGFELLGVPKPKESTSAFFKSLSLVKEKYGNVYVNFGTPISAFEYFGDKIDRSLHCRKPIYMQMTTQQEREATLALAHTIVHSQQKLAVITTFNLIAIIIIDTIIHKNERLTMEKLMQEMVWLKAVIEKFGAVTDFVSMMESVLDSLLVHRNLVTMTANGDIEFVENAISLEKMDRTRLKGHDLHEGTMIKSVPIVTVQLYVNPTLHYFVNPSLVTIVLKTRFKENAIPKDVLFGEYSYLRSLFSKEFVLFPMNEQTEFENSLIMLEDTKIITTLDCIRLNTNEKLQHLLCNLIQPFFFTYYIVCTILLDMNFKSENHIICATQAEIERLLNSNSFLHPYSLSLDTISNCLQSLVDIKAVHKTKRNGSMVYVVQNNILESIGGNLYEYVIHLIPSFKIALVAKL